MSLTNSFVLSSAQTDRRYKDNVLCYLLSHVNSVSSPEIQRRLLNLVDGIPHSLKAELLLPLLQVLVDETHPERLVSRFGSNLESITSSVVSSLDNSIASSLNEQDSTLWPIFLASLRSYLRTGMPIYYPNNPLTDRFDVIFRCPVFTMHDPYEQAEKRSFYEPYTGAQNRGVKSCPGHRISRCRHGKRSIVIHISSDMPVHTSIVPGLQATPHRSARRRTPHGAFIEMAPTVGPCRFTSRKQARQDGWGAVVSWHDISSTI